MKFEVCENYTTTKVITVEEPDEKTFRIKLAEGAYDSLFENEDIVADSTTYDVNIEGVKSFTVDY